MENPVSCIYPSHSIDTSTKVQANVTNPIDAHLLLLILDIAHVVAHMVLLLLYQIVVSSVQIQKRVGDVILAIVAGDVVYADSRLLG